MLLREKLLSSYINKLKTEVKPLDEFTRGYHQALDAIVSAKRELAAYNWEVPETIELKEMERKL